MSTHSGVSEARAFPYETDPLDALGLVSDRRYPVLLHGTHSTPGRARCTVLGVDPVAVLSVRDGGGLCTANLRREFEINLPEENPAWALARQLEALLEHCRVPSVLPKRIGSHGATIGYMGYDLSTRFEEIGSHSGPRPAEPCAWWGLYPVLAVWDHRRRAAYISASTTFRSVTDREPDIERNADRLLQRLTEASSTGERERHAPQTLSPAELDALWAKTQSSFTYEAYRDAFDRILEHIRRGDIYQANLTQQFQWTGEARSPVESFRRLFAQNPAEYSAYIDTGDVQILSTSPELLLCKSGQHVVTSPIKGTLERKGDDDAERRELLACGKNAAEHIMIVDLERNDLGRLCRCGTVRPKALRTVETLPNLHHLVSDVEGVLRDGVRLAELLSAILPGGSITGAPKVRAMQVIRSVEPVPRGIYTGSIGFIEPNGDLSLNIAIRTIVNAGSRIGFGVGGGIVADSDVRNEYEESLLKGRSLLCACT